MLLKKYFTIGEVAELLDLEPHVIRFWEKNFSIIDPQKARGRRYYTKDDINSLNLIKKMLYVEKISIKAAQNIFCRKTTKKLPSNKLKLTHNDIETGIESDVQQLLERMLQTRARLALILAP